MSHNDKIILTITEEDEYPSELQAWRIEGGQLELAIVFYHEAQSIVLTREQESQLKLALVSR